MKGRYGWSLPGRLEALSARAYIGACERITGRPFLAPPHEGPILARIRANLARFF